MDYVINDFIYESNLAADDLNICDVLIDRYNNSMPLASDWMGSDTVQSDPLIRDDKCVFGTNDFANLLVEVLDEHIKTYMKEVKYNKNIFFDTVKIQKTIPSEGYHIWHWEVNPLDPAASCREVVYTIYLNDVEEGGETEFLHQAVRIKPKKGKVLFFPSSFTHTHRGNPPLSGDKYIATGWLTNTRFTISA